MSADLNAQADVFEALCSEYYRLASEDFVGFCKSHPHFTFHRTIDYPRPHLGCGPHDSISTYPADLMTSIGNYVREFIGFGRWQFQVVTFLNQNTPRIFATFHDPS